MTILWKGLSILFLVLLALFFNYPTYTTLLFDNSEEISVDIAKKYENISKLLEELDGYNVAIQQSDKNRIQILKDSAKETFPLDNPVIKEILENNFSLVTEGTAMYLSLKNASNGLFISDFTSQLNSLFTNLRKIKSIAITEKKDGITFLLDETRRLSSESEPIKTLIGDDYTWTYVPEKSLYDSRPKENEYLISLGLDLQGGMYLDVGVDEEEIYKNVLERLSFDLEENLINDGVDYEEVVILDKRSVEIVLADFEELDLEQPQYLRLLESFEISKNESGYIARFKEEDLERIQQNALDQVVDTINNRIDALGVKEPSIQKKGDGSSIIIQLPGQSDPARSKSILTKPASLEFRMIKQDATISNPGSGVVMNEEVRDPLTKEVLEVIPYVVENKVALRGDVINDARVVFSQMGIPEVNISFNSLGAEQFANITKNNVQRQFAIILDGKIQSAPVIQTPIYGGQASITGQFSPDQAKDLAIVLRSGALPAPLIIQEERTIGASLGADSVRLSLLSLVVGFSLVVLFIIVYYRVSGLFSVLALFFNILIIIAVLAYFGATLTLPGMAGIILTIGMAVDANVLIFERIREEIQRGNAPRKAVKSGFRRASVTILDANITTIIAAIVLFQFGTGPIKGFSVTLAIGILASMFTSIIVTRYLFELVYLRKKNLRSISI